MHTWKFVRFSSEKRCLRCAIAEYVIAVCTAEVVAEPDVARLPLEVGIRVDEILHSSMAVAFR